MQDHHSHGHTHTMELPTSIDGLPDARRPETVELSDGGEYGLEIAPVRQCQVAEKAERFSDGRVWPDVEFIAAKIARHQHRRHRHRQAQRSAPAKTKLVRPKGASRA